MDPRGWPRPRRDTQGLLGSIFWGPSDDLPGSILGPLQDLRATFGHLGVTPAWPIKAFSKTFGGHSGTGKQPKLARKGDCIGPLGTPPNRDLGQGMPDLFPGPKRPGKAK